MLGEISKGMIQGEFVGFARLKPYAFLRAGLALLLRHSTAPDECTRPERNQCSSSGRCLRGMHKFSLNGSASLGYRASLRFSRCFSGRQRLRLGTGNFPRRFGSRALSIISPSLPATRKRPSWCSACPAHSRTTVGYAFHLLKQTTRKASAHGTES